ncbi:MAG: competence protein CoiA family protein [Chlamydiota bacterium]|nr:competence protein CoiA family protein [Chlamydiota bacterium]
MNLLNNEEKSHLIINLDIFDSAMISSPHLSLHRLIQRDVMGQFSEGQLVMEYAFPTIGRRADLVWISNKMIIEIQCSSISLREVLMRTLDYATLGYSLFWILHDHCFNKDSVSEAEDFLRSGRSCFTNLMHQGGIYYNQEESIDGGYRTKRGAPIEISLFDYLGVYR